MATRPTGTLAVNETDLHYGDTVTFTTQAGVTPTYVRLTCYQEDAVVAIGHTVYCHTTDEYVTDTTGLYAPIWQSGAAHCVAELVQVLRHPRKPRVLATITFEVAA